MSFVSSLEKMDKGQNTLQSGALNNVRTMLEHEHIAKHKKTNGVPNIENLVEDEKMKKECKPGRVVKMGFIQEMNKIGNTVISFKNDLPKIFKFGNTEKEDSMNLSGHLTNRRLDKVNTVDVGQEKDHMVSENQESDKKSRLVNKEDVEIINDMEKRYKALMEQWERRQKRAKKRYKLKKPETDVAVIVMDNVKNIVEPEARDKTELVAKVEKENMWDLIEKEQKQEMTEMADEIEQKQEMAEIADKIEEMEKSETVVQVEPIDEMLDGEGIDNLAYSNKVNIKYKARKVKKKSYIDGERPKQFKILSPINSPRRSDFQDPNQIGKKCMLAKMIEFLWKGKATDTENAITYIEKVNKVDEAQKPQQVEMGEAVHKVESMEKAGKEDQTQESSTLFAFDENTSLRTDIEQLNCDKDEIKSMIEQLNSNFFKAQVGLRKEMIKNFEKIGNAIEGLTAKMKVLEAINLEKDKKIMLLEAQINQLELA